MPRKTAGHGHDTRYVRLQKNFCFACGKNNPEGMRLKFVYNEERNGFVCRFRLGKRYLPDIAMAESSRQSWMRQWAR